MILLAREWCTSAAILVGATLLITCGPEACGAEEATGGEDVQWQLASPSESALAPGDSFALKIRADIAPGWHIYGLHEPAGGPTALGLILSDDSAALAAGEATGPAPLKKFDRSFNLPTQTYSGAVELQLPLKLKADLAAGPHTLPVKIRFQSCSDRECRPPRTVQLDVQVDVVPDAARAQISLGSKAP
jgi:DsbC/DsbD-like thiol-disulfide interchange protein